MKYTSPNVYPLSDASLNSLTIALAQTGQGSSINQSFSFQNPCGQNDFTIQDLYRINVANPNTAMTMIVDPGNTFTSFSTILTPEDDFTCQKFVGNSSNGDPISTGSIVCQNRSYILSVTAPAGETGNYTVSIEADKTVAIDSTINDDQCHGGLIEFGTVQTCGLPEGSY